MDNRAGEDILNGTDRWQRSALQAAVSITPGTAAIALWPLTGQQGIQALKPSCCSQG